MKIQRQSVIRELLGAQPVASQDDLRRRLAQKGFRVTQATLSRDIHDLRLSKGPAGYALPGTLPATDDAFDDSLPAVAELLATFGVEIRQAANLLVFLTAKGAAQPVAAGIDDEEWPECLGTIAGDNTVLLICADLAAATTLRARLEALIG